MPSAWGTSVSVKGVDHHVGTVTDGPNELDVFHGLQQELSLRSVRMWPCCCPPLPFARPAVECAPLAPELAEAPFTLQPDACFALAMATSRRRSDGLMRTGCLGLPPFGLALVVRVVVALVDDAARRDGGALAATGAVATIGEREVPAPFECCNDVEVECRVEGEGATAVDFVAFISASTRARNSSSVKSEDADMAMVWMNE